MSDKKPLICFFCMGIIENNDCVMLEQMERKILLTLRINIDCTTSKLIICWRCKRQLQWCFDFKSTCLGTEPQLTGLININNSDKVQKQDTVDDDVNVTKNMCRFCTTLVEDNNYVKLDDTKENIYTMDMMQNYMPELDFTSIHNRMSCKSCFNSLLNFVNCCVKIEKIFKENCDSNKRDGEVQFNFSQTEALDIKDNRNYMKEGLDDLSIHNDSCSTKNSIKEDLSDPNITIYNNWDNLHCTKEDLDDIKIELDVSEVTTNKKCEDQNDTITNFNNLDFKADVLSNKGCSKADLVASEIDIKKDLRKRDRKDSGAKVSILHSLSANAVSNILLKADFSKLQLKEKLKIKELGRPLPELQLSQVCEIKAENRRFTRRFSTDVYKKNVWICGCEITNSLFCFPCLLFYDTESGMGHSWARAGVRDLQHLLAKIRKHESSHGHIIACTNLALLGKENMSFEYRESLLEHNNKVRRNRDILKRIICSVKFCNAFDLALRGYEESGSSENRKIPKESIDFSAELDAILKEHLENGTVFERTSETIKNDILDCILQVCREEIYNQIQNADFLSIQCDETSDVSNSCQMGLILRYFYDGSIHESFWSFMTVKDKAADLKTCIVSEVNRLVLKTPEKLIAQTYDGASVTSGSTSAVQVQIKQKYPIAHIVHCYAHELNLIIQKAASQNSKVRVFFNNLSAIPAFFSSSSHRCDVLEDIVSKTFPLTRWTYNIRTVNFVCENHEKFVQVFEEIESRCEKSVTSNQASALRRALEDPEFMFWLTFFHKILPQVDAFYNKLRSENKDGIEIQKDLLIFKKTIASIKSDADNVKESVERDFGAAKRKRTDDTRRSTIAKEVCDVITTQMNERFSCRGHLQAAKLLDRDSYSDFSKTFPVNILDAVTTSYPMLRKSRLRTELEVIYSRQDLKAIVGALRILTLMLENNLAEIYVETVKLLKIVVTTPMPTAEVERCFTTLKRIKTFLRNTMPNDRLNALAMMSINKNLVHEISNFEERVMEKFICMKDHRADFTFKK